MRGAGRRGQEESFEEDSEARKFRNMVGTLDQVVEKGREA